MAGEGGAGRSAGGGETGRGGARVEERILGNPWRPTYLPFAIVPPGTLVVTETNYTARTYHRGAVPDLGLDPAVLLELNHVVQRVPRPRAGGGRGQEGV